MFSGNTLYCGNRQQPQPQWSNQGYGQGQGYNQGYGQGQRYNQGYGQEQAYGATSVYPLQTRGGCTSGGCSTGYSGHQSPPAQPPFVMTSMAGETIQAVTLPEPIVFDEDVQEDGSGAEQ